MVYVKEYWENKEKRAKTAMMHTEEMQKKYSREILEAVRDTIVYSPDFKNNKIKTQAEQKIILKNIDSVGAIFEEDSYNDKRMAVLNFASYKNPGGMFINGSKAQEECLCHESFLYNVLKEFPEYYEWNQHHKNKALYLNRALYTYNVVFEKNGKSTTCDVITCAAPNIFTGRKYNTVSEKENTATLDDRIRFVLDIAKDNDVDILILGAYGCGVFGQDPEEVARIFKHYLDTTYRFEKVIFAIPDNNSTNYKSFRNIFE